MSLDILEIEDQQRKAIVESETIEFCCKMIHEGALEKNAPKTRLYLEILEKHMA